MKKPISIAVIALMAAGSPAWAAESQYSGTFCGHAKATVLQASPELTLLMSESWGIQTPESGFKPWANATVHCVGYRRVIQGKATALGACRWTDSTGDTFAGEYRILPDEPSLWTFLGGTGKWKGVQGTGTFKFASMGKPAADGTTQYCTEHQGSYTLLQ